MHINVILHHINQKLMGENLMYIQALPYMDEVIDDINVALNARFPSFSDFDKETYPKYPNYNFFPDKYIRSVVVTGVAYKFLTADEEGISTATQYGYDYKNALFYMQRDWSMHVPLPYMGCDENGTYNICELDNYHWDDNGDIFRDL